VRSIWSKSTLSVTGTEEVHSFCGGVKICPTGRWLAGQQCIQLGNEALVDKTLHSLLCCHMPKKILDFEIHTPPALPFTSLLKIQCKLPLSS